MVVFVNKVSSLSNNQTFKGVTTAINNAGIQGYKFYYPSGENSAKIKFYRTKRNDDNNSGWQVDEEPIKEVEIPQYKHVFVNPIDIERLGSGDSFAYKIFVNGNPVPDSGIRIAENCNLITQNTSSPIVQGPGVFAVVDSYMPGAKYYGYDNEKTGKIYYDKEYQKEVENIPRTFSNRYGGSLAGLEYDMPILKKRGIKVLFTTPTGGGDNVSSHRYWTNENKQIPVDLGTKENYASFIKSAYKNGITHVFDATFTSEGLAGINVQYALRWSDRKTAPYYRYKMIGLKDEPLGFGVIPRNDENVRHRVINAPVKYNPKTKKVENNPAYDSGKETLVQLYDASQVTDEQLADLNKPIDTYRNLKSGNFLSINTHNDTPVNYVFQVSPKEYQKQLNDFAKYNRKIETPVDENSAEGTIQICRFANFDFRKKTEGGFVAWDANTDMVKKNYGISGYDEKQIMAIDNRGEREEEKRLRARGAYENWDIAVQDITYWEQFYKNQQIIYTAQILQDAKTSENIKNLIALGLLPEEAELNEETVQNVLKGDYVTSDTEKLDKDDTTIKALMKLPLSSLELGDNIIGILAQPFFTNLAPEEKYVGLTRFELWQQENPHLVEPYKKTYEKMNALFTNEIKNFADEVIKKLNEKSKEKLLDENGDYTYYGRNVIELLGQDIAKYTLLKAFRRDELRTKILNGNSYGEVTYDYNDLRQNITLKQLSINAGSPETEAEELGKYIQKGLKKLSDKDAEYLAEAFSQRLNGTNNDSFELAKAIVHKAGLGMSIRLDAAKDVMDMDAVRSGEMSFDDAWDKVIEFYKKIVENVKKINPNAYIIAELTDIQQLINITGSEKYKNENEAVLKFMVETGITSEAGYSYFFTDLLKVFSPDFESGEANNELSSRIAIFMNKFKELTEKRSVDYARNLYTFAGNHDKPRTLHGLALDMGLFHGKLNISYPNGKADFDTNYDQRLAVLQVLSNADALSDMPVELALNVYNPEFFKNATFSTKAVAMSKLLRDCINDTLTKDGTGIAPIESVSSDELAALRQAVTDLANANYLGEGSNLDLCTLKESALSSIEGALTEMLNACELDSKKKAEIIQKINKFANEDKLKWYALKGDFDWEEPNKEIGNENRNRLKIILQANNEDYELTKDDFKKYDLYTVSLAALIRDGFDTAGYDSDEKLKTAFYNAQREFVNKYNRDKVESLRKRPVIENPQIMSKKDGYGSRDIKMALEGVLNQAEYILRKQGNLGENDHLKNRDEILVKVFRQATEPAVEKLCMYMAFLSAVMGNPTLYAGDEKGMSGYDEKAKNMYLQNRNALWHGLENDNLFHNYIKEIDRRVNEAMQIRTRDGAKALSDGTYYFLPSPMTKDENDNYKPQNTIPALMAYNADGNAVISVFNATAVQTGNRFNYHKYLKGDSIDNYYSRHTINSINKDNKYVPIQPGFELDCIPLIAMGGAVIGFGTGYVFRNTLPGDTAEYEVRDILGVGKAIVNKNGGKIVLNDVTAPNGVLVLADGTHIDAAKNAREAKAKQKKNVLETSVEKFKNQNKGNEQINNSTLNPITNAEEKPLILAKTEPKSKADPVLKPAKKGNKKAWIIGVVSVAAIAAGYEIIKNKRKGKSAKQKDLDLVV